jgi:hypothetical protein
MALIIDFRGRRCAQPHRRFHIARRWSPHRRTAKGFFLTQKRKTGRMARLLMSWRKGWDSNPRYGITVHRISSPAHSTTLPPFRLVDGMQLICHISCPTTAYFASPSWSLFGEAKIIEHRKQHSKLFYQEGRKPRRRTRSITPAPAPSARRRPDKDAAPPALSPSHRHSGNSRARQRACAPPRGRSR